jgi:hypothetical protein
LQTADVVANKVTGTVTQIGIGDIENHGHCYSYTSAMPSINNEHTALGPLNFYENNTFESELNNLSSGITYYIRSYCYSNGKYYYGNSISYTAQ